MFLQYSIVQVLEIVSSQTTGKLESSKYFEQQENHNEKMQNAIADLSQKVYHLRLYSQTSQISTHLNLNSLFKVRYFYQYLNLIISIFIFNII